MVHRSMQGKMVDMEKLMRQNELVPAVGNARVNARGDKLGPGGAIIKKREEIVAEYYVEPVEAVAPVIEEPIINEPEVNQKPASSAPKKV